jgi:hypothetical protein
MLRKASVLWGLAVLLSLLFPLKAVLRQTGVDPLALRLQGLDLAGLCAVLAMVPAIVLCRDGQLERRIPSWNVWVVLLALFSLLFLLLHVSWSLALVTDYVREVLAPGGAMPLPVSHRTVVHGAELAARLGVLVCMVGVLVNLHAVPDPDAPVRKRRSRK